jgi:hypothetical protein
MPQTDLEITNILAELLSCKTVATTNQCLNNISINNVAEQAVKHGVAAVIYQQWLNFVEPPNIDLSLWADVDKQLNIIHCFLTPETAQVFKALRANKIGFVVLKGYALSEQVYRKPYVRPRTDIDIIIDPVNSNALIEMFQDLGFRNPRGWQPQTIIDQYSFTKTIAKGITLSFDVHLKISNDKTLQPLITYEDLSATASSKRDHFPQLIDKPHALIHAVIHLLNHRIHGDLVKLIWFYDIWLLVEKLTEDESQVLTKLITVKGLSALFCVVLTNTNDYFYSAKIQILIASLVKVDANPSFNYLLEKPSLLAIMWHNFTTNKGARAKLAYLHETVFPPKEELYLKYGAHSRWPLLLLYIRRIVTGAFKWVTRG